MKKYVLCSVLIASIAAPAMSFAQSNADIDPREISSCIRLSANVGYRMRDAETNGSVSSLQSFLQDQKYFNQEPTGFFGLITVAAVKNFQASNGISPTSFVGPLTRAKITALSCGGTSIPTPTPGTPGTTIPTPNLPGMVVSLDPTSPIGQMQKSSSMDVAKFRFANNSASNVTIRSVVLEGQSKGGCGFNNVKIIDSKGSWIGESIRLVESCSGTIGNLNYILPSYSTAVLGVRIDGTGLAPISDTINLTLRGVNSAPAGTSWIGLPVMSNPIVVVDTNTGFPSINFLNPSSGPIGAAVTIGGSGFTSDSRVNFGPGAIISSNVKISPDGTAIVFTVPQSVGAYCPLGVYCIQGLTPIEPGRSYPVSVTTGKGTSNTVSFYVEKATTLPLITVLTPKQGDTWIVGTTYRISWQPFSGTADTFIYLNGGGNAEGYSKYIGSPYGNSYLDYGVTDADLPTAPGYSWRVGVCNGKLVSGGSNCGWSGEVFVVKRPTQLSITVLSPNGGEKFVQGGVMHASWKASTFSPNDVTLNLIKSDRTQWYPIFNNGYLNIPNTGSFDWRIPTDANALGYAPPGDYKLRIAPRYPDFSTANVFDDSDAWFIIGAPPTTNTITVQTSGDSPTGSITAGQSAVTLAKFNVYAAGEAMKIKWLGWGLNIAGAGSALIDNLFGNVSLVDDTGAQVATVNNLSYTVSCTDTPFNGSNVSYRNCFGSNFSPINYVVPANTTRVLTIKADVKPSASFTSVTALLTGNALNVQGLTTGQNLSTGLANGKVLTLGGTTQPSITVLSPNGGEQLSQGQGLSIRWTSTGGPDFVGLNLTQNGNHVFGIGNVANTGSYYWTIPTTFSGSGFKIKAFGNGVTDESDGAFSILPALNASYTAWPDRTSGNAPLTITFTVNLTNHASCGISYEWQFGDGQTSNWVDACPAGSTSSVLPSRNVTQGHTYTQGGTYPVWLRVNGVPQSFVQVATISVSGAVGSESSSFTQMANLLESYRLLLEQLQTQLKSQ